MTPARLDDAIVLVVDDHEDSRDALTQMLESLGATVMQARDGREALKRIGERVPALILCDLKMPGMDGFAFMHALATNARRDSAAEGLSWFLSEPRAGSGI